MVPALEAAQLGKSFGGARACDRVSFALGRGEVLALVGENGAGKTTLLNLLNGFYRPDVGEIRVRGTPVVLRGPADAEALGLGMVHQHFTLVPPLGVAENVVLGREPRRGPVFDRARAEREVAEAAERHGLPIDPRAKVAHLSVASRQRVEILKVLWRGAEILAFDEPTAALSPDESTALCATIRDLAKGGRSILFVSHKLREVASVADRIAVLRAGRIVAVLPAAGADLGRVAALMVGEAAPREEPPSRTEVRAAGAVLSLGGVICNDDRGAPALRGVDLSVGSGEVVGIAGVDGNGQRELAEVCTGLRPPAAGRVEVGGRDARGLGAAGFRALGVAHVPEDRERGGLCGALTVAENLALGRAWRPPFREGRLFPQIDRRFLAGHADELVRAYDVRPPDPSARACDLSGGNQQKVVLARELDGTPALVVAVHPTRGLDLRAAAAVHARLRDQARRGAGVLIVSFDLDELRAVADRLVVLCGGQVAGEASNSATDAELSRFMAGAA